MVENPISARIVAEHLRFLHSIAADMEDPKKLSKLVYLCHGWMLGFRGFPLIKERILVEETGPIVESLSHIEAHNRSAEIGPVQLHVIEIVDKAYAARSAEELSDLTHAEGTPWHALQGRPTGTEIPTSKIRKHYKKMAKDADLLLRYQELVGA